MTSSGPKNIRNSSPVFFLSHRSYSNTHTHLSQVSISQHMDNQTDRSFFNQDVISTTPGPEPQRQRSVIHLSHFFSGASEPPLSHSLSHTHTLLAQHNPALIKCIETQISGHTVFPEGSLVTRLMACFQGQRSPSPHTFILVIKHNRQNVNCPLTCWCL